MRLIATLSMISVLVLASACSDDDPIVLAEDAGVDGALTPDLGTDMALPADGPVVEPDMFIPQPDLPTNPSALQVVIDSLTLPTTAQEYAVDLDGNGTQDNQLGALMGGLGAFGGSFDIQGGLDSSFTSGDVLLLLDVLADGLQNAAPAQVQTLLGEDLDVPENPYDNFSGSEPFGIDPESPMNILLDGAITAGRLSAGPGTFIIPIPVGVTTTTLTITRAQAQADVSAAGMQNGQINGAIPWTEVEGKLLPEFATMLDEMWKSGTSMLSMLDTDGDGTITGPDLANNFLIGIFLKKDVDTDGDGQPDAMSVGAAFTAVPCEIQR